MPDHDAGSGEQDNWLAAAANAMRVLASVIALGLLIVLVLILAVVVVSDRG